MIPERLRVRSFEAKLRERALLFTCAGAVILLFCFNSPKQNWSGLNWPASHSAVDQARVDAALQQAALNALGQREGAIIAMDAQTGRIRALVNAQLASGQAMMPGSTMKPFTALAALRAGLIDNNSRTVCPGRFTGRDFSLPCVHEDHLPPFSPSQAIAYSCNYYFATLGQRLGREKLIETARSFGFGQRTGIGDDVPGTLRACENSNRDLESDHATRQSDCDAREAIGESDQIQVTPVQLLTAYAALVNGGRLLEPRVAAVDDFTAHERDRIEISDQHRAIILEGMRGAVRYGTARKARLDSLPIYVLGKTGTSMPPRGFRSNGWFVGFAANRSPDSTTEPKAGEIKLAVLVLLARSHGSEAAELARPIFETYQSANSATIAADEAGPKNSAVEIANSRDAGDSRGTIRVHLVTENVTRELSLEDYVLGVMRAEGSMETEPEALKSLAVAIRTYAVRNRGRHARDGYDFCTTTHCQRFIFDPTKLASNTASDLLLQAVRATEGQVLRDDQDQLVDAYFGASCGGATANIGTLWGKVAPSYLRGVRDEYCLSGPHANWTDSISRADLLRALQSDSRTDVGSRLDRVLVNKRDDTGRAELITLEGDQRKIVKGWDFKIIVGRVLGWNLLKSSRFDVVRNGANFIFHGSGFGHGLGLCQEGAHVMALRGANYQRILAKYFPGTTIKRDERPVASSNETKTPSIKKADTQAMTLRPLTFRRDFRSRAPLSHHATTKKTATLSSEHFRVTYPIDLDRKDANQVVSILESARADYLHRAAAASVTLANIPSLEIHLNESTGDFTGRTGQPWWAAAATQGNRIELQPVTLLNRRGILITTLRHELAHVVIDSLSQNRAPRWLAEGFAIYLAGEGPMISRYAHGPKLSSSELESRLQKPKSQAEMRSLYAASFQEVSDIIRSEGEGGIWRRLSLNI